MPAPWALTPEYFLVLAFFTGVVGFRIGWRTRQRLALPLAQGFLGWLVFLLAWATVGAGWSAACVGAWAIGTTLTSIYVFLGRPEETDRRVLRATDYRRSMLAWLESGESLETDASRMAERHLREAIWYVAAAVATANLASLVIGAVLLNFMNAYVATLVRAAKRMGPVLLLSWNVWSLIRVAAYVMIGAAASAPVLRMLGWRVDTKTATSLALAGAAGLVLDVMLKLALSRTCGRALRQAVDLDVAKANRSASAPLTLHLD